MNQLYQHKYLDESLKILKKEFSFFVAKYMVYKYMSKEDMEDMKSESTLFLLQTLPKFDESKNVKLSTFLGNRLTGFFKDYVEKFLKIKYINFSDSNKEDWTKKPEITDNVNVENEAINLIKSIILQEYQQEFSIEDIKTTNDTLSVLGDVSDEGLYIVLGYYIFNKKIKEIAEEMGVSPTSGWVYKMKKRTLEIIKQKLNTKGE